MSLKSFIQSTPELIDANELCFFAGSFNPWHDGHTSCLRLIDSGLQVIVAPDHNPFKELILQSQKASDLNEIKNHIKVREKNTHLFKDFFTSDSKNPTYKWVEELKVSHPQKQISLLMGFDTFTAIHTWTNANSLINNLSTIYVVSRLDTQILKEEQIKRLNLINPKLMCDFLGNHPHEHMSSTQLRKDS
jgi:nicotinate-nucleotide adenylyltransferase